MRGGLVFLAALAAAGLVAGRACDGGGRVPEDAPPSLRFHDADVELGRVPHGAAPIVEAPWRRVGRGALRVIAVRTGCGCAAAEGVPGTVGEAAEGVLRVRLSPRERPGPFQVVVRVFLDAPPPGDVASLRLRGYVGDLPVAEPPVVDLGARTAGSRVTRRVETCFPPGDAAVVVAGTLEGLEGTVAAVPPARAGRRGGDLLVTLRVPDRPGPFQGVLQVAAGAGARIPVPVRGLAVRPADPEGPGPPPR